jgi:hypothetical protein
VYGCNIESNDLISNPKYTPFLWTIPSSEHNFTVELTTSKGAAGESVSASYFLTWFIHLDGPRATLYAQFHNG